MRTLLVIGYVWPEPKSSAAGCHMLSIIRLFKSNNWRVIFSTPAQQTDFNANLDQEGIETKSIEINDSSFDRYVHSLQPNAVLYDRFMMEEQFGWRVSEACPQALQILDTEDLQCLRNARHDALKRNRPFHLTDLFSDLARREIASIYRCDLSLIISDYETELLQKYFSVNPELFIHIPFMLDLNTSKKPSTSLDFEYRRHFVTIGNLRHAPNWDSVLYLQKIWPKIRQTIPDAELHIYGAYTPPKATALNNPKNGFIIKNRAEDVNEVMEKARICLSPLRFGAGIKGKFVDAMRMGTPIITTDTGAEGMTAGLPWPGFIANSVDELANRAIELYQDKDLWEQKNSYRETLLNEIYDGDKIGQRLLSRIERLLNNLEEHRAGNFIGSMLSYHSMRSTKFMSKWIEEKNKINGPENSV